MARMTRRTWLRSAVSLAPTVRFGAFASQPSAAVSLDDFVELSKRLLERRQVDRELAQVYLSALLADPDTAISLANLAQSNGNPTFEQAAVARTIIEWWYTGIYTRGGKTFVATHTGALMWSALGRPAPGTCAGAFGAWSRPPESIV